MSIATDPKMDNNDDTQDEFEAEFKRIAEGGKPSPVQENEDDPDPPEGNGPSEDDAAPAGDEDDPAATGEDEEDDATSGDAEKSEGGGQPPEDNKAPDNDPWKDAPAELRSLYEATQKERDEARHRAASDAARVAALGRKLEALTHAQTSAATAPDPKAKEAKEALDNKVKQLREDYGEIADPLIELIESQRRELDTVRSSLVGMSEQQQAQRIAAEQAALETAHPDWRAIAGSTDFRGWLEVQPENIQRMAKESWDARETSVVLSLFKAERIEASGQMGNDQQQQQQDDAQKAKAATGEKRSQQLDGGKVVKNRPAPAASGPPEDFEAAFKYYEEKRRQKALANQR